MGRVQINTPAAGSSESGSTVIGQPSTESVTFLLNPKSIAAPSVTVVPSFALGVSDLVGVSVVETTGNMIGTGGKVFYLNQPESGIEIVRYGKASGTWSFSNNEIFVSVRASGVTVRTLGSFSGSNAIVTVTFTRYSDG